MRQRHGEMEELFGRSANALPPAAMADGEVRFRYAIDMATLAAAS